MMDSLAILEVLAFSNGSLPQDFLEITRLRVSNAELAALTEDPDLVARIVAHGRLDGLEQDVRRPMTPDGVAFHIFLSLYADARLAAAELAQPVAPAGFAAIGALTGAGVTHLRPEELTLPHVLGIRFSGESPDGAPLDGLAVRLQAGRLVAVVTGIGPGGSLPDEDVWTLAAALQTRLEASPLPPASASERAAVAGQTAGESILRDAFLLLHGFHHRTLSPAALLQAACQGAATLLPPADGERPSTSPRVSSSDPAVAWLEFVPAYQELAGRAGIDHDRALAHAAATRMYEGHDCHTAFLEPPLFRRFVAASRGDARVALGITVSVRAPYLVLRMTPASPAAAAGLQVGDEVIAVDGLPPDGTGGVSALVAGRDEDKPLAVAVLRPSLAEPLTVDIIPRSVRAPVARHRILPSGLGYCELSDFPRGDQAVARTREALDAFAAARVYGWILDLRYNGGGWARTMCRIAGLFLPEGSQLTTQPLPDGTERRQFSLGPPFPEQQPLVVLIGPTSVSAAEIVAESLRGHGRAVLVGARTAGCVNGGRHFALLDGSGVRIAEFEFLVGPRQIRLESSGVEPDIAVDLSRDDLLAGRDPQLAAAERALLARG